MATVSSSESAAPRDFQISVSSDSGGYTRCMLCAAGRRIFHCADCIAAGNFVHTSAPYSERFSDKQLRLHRIRANRKYVNERCESLLVGRRNRERLQIETNQCKEKVNILKLAIEQTKKNVEEKSLQLAALSKYNGELQFKLPRYEKRVCSMEKHAATRRVEVQDKAWSYEETANILAALRRARLRQLTKYIFPVRLTYDAQDSLDENDEFLQDVKVVEQPDKMRRVNLHIVSAWLPANGDYSQYTQWVSQHKDNGAGTEQQLKGAEHPVHRISAGLSLAAQLTALAACILSVRLPYNLSFSDYCTGTQQAWLVSRVRRLYACLVWLGLHARQPPPPEHRHTLTLLHALCTAAATDDEYLGRVETALSGFMLAAAEAWSSAWSAAGGGGELSDDDEPEPPEHLSWAADWDNTEEMSAISSSPPQPVPASLVTSAAASIASIWRGWTK